MVKAIVFLDQNIRLLRSRCKKSQQELAAELGITRSKLNSYENGVAKNLPVEDLLRLSAYFKMSIDTLLKVDLAALSASRVNELEAGNDAYITGTHLRVLATTVDRDNNDNVELVPLKAKAGYTSGYNDPEFIGTLPSFQLPTLNPQRKYRMFQLDGDSMLLPDGTFVIGEFVDDWHSIKDGKEYVMLIKNEGLVFKSVYNQLKETRQLVMHSLNPEYGDYNVPISEVLEVWKFVSYLSSRMPEGGLTLHKLLAMVNEADKKIS